MKNRGLITGILVAIGIAVVAVFAVRMTAAKPMHAMTINFPTAAGLVPGSDVFEAGAKVGTINSIEPDTTNHAIVEIGIEDDHWPLHQGLTAGIRPKSLLGEKYVDLHDGAGSAAAYDPSQTLNAPADSTPVELDQFINSLDPSTRTSAKVLLNDLGAGLAGRGNDLNAAIQSGKDDLANLAVTGTTLNNRDPDLDRILVGLDGVLQKLTQDDQLTQMSQLISNGQQTLNAIEAERSSFQRSFTDSQAALTDLNAAIDPAVQSLRDTLNTAPHLLSVVHDESDVLAQMGAQLTNGNLLQLLANNLIHGSTASGGALETFPDGRKLPIFRVCLRDAASASGDSCVGHGYTAPGPQSVPVTARVDGSDSGDMAALIGFLGA